MKIDKIIIKIYFLIFFSNCTNKTNKKTIIITFFYELVLQKTFSADTLFQNRNYFFDNIFLRNGINSLFISFRILISVYRGRN